MNRGNKQRIAASIKQNRLLTPSDLELQFREWQRLRKVVDELEKGVEQKDHGVGRATTKRRRA